MVAGDGCGHADVSTANKNLLLCQSTLSHPLSSVLQVPGACTSEQVLLFEPTKPTFSTVEYNLEITCCYFLETVLWEPIKKFWGWLSTRGRVRKDF